MNETNENTHLRGAFPKTIQAGNGNSPIADLNKHRKSSQLFAVASKGQIASCFKVITRYGRSYSIKYAHLPHVVLEGSELYIILYDLQVLITGRGLEVIEEAIAKSTLFWVKESPSGKDDEKSSVFIDGIQVKGSVHRLIGKFERFKDDQ